MTENYVIKTFPSYTTYEDKTECSETSVHKIQKPRNRPKEIKRQIKYKFAYCVAGYAGERGTYEGWNFNSGNYLFTTDTK